MCTYPALKRWARLCRPTSWDWRLHLHPASLPGSSSLERVVDPSSTPAADFSIRHVWPRSPGRVHVLNGREHILAEEEGQSKIERTWLRSAQGAERRVARTEQQFGILNAEVDDTLTSVCALVGCREKVRR